jgi:hypothetical protein
MTEYPSSPIYEDQSFHYKETEFHLTVGGQLFHYIKLKNDKEFMYPVIVDIGVNTIKINDERNSN